MDPLILNVVLCPACGRGYGRAPFPDEKEPEVCDSCFVCAQCRKRWAYSVADPPPLGICDDCWAKEDLETGH